MPSSDAPQAVWLDARRIRWPQVVAEPGTSFKLVASASAGLQVRVGEPLAGADAELGLWPADALVSDALIQRYRHVASGVELQLRTADRQRLPDLLSRQLLLVQIDAQQRVRRFGAVNP